MAINLSTVSISLDRFDAVSDGEYNIGHVNLSKDGSDIVRTNRHKTFEFLNKAPPRRDACGQGRVLQCAQAGALVRQVYGRHPRAARPQEGYGRLALAPRHAAAYSRPGSRNPRQVRRRDQRKQGLATPGAQRMNFSSGPGECWAFRRVAWTRAEPVAVDVV